MAADEIDKRFPDGLIWSFLTKFKGPLLCFKRFYSHYRGDPCQKYTRGFYLKVFNKVESLLTMCLELL